MPELGWAEFEPGRKDHPREAGGQGAERIDDQRRLPHVDAGELRDLGATPDGIERASSRAESQHDPGDCDDYDHHRDRHGQKAEVTYDCQIREPIRETDDLLAVGDHARKAARDRHHGQRRDEGGHIQPRHHEAGHDPAQRRSDHRGYDRKAERQAEVIAHKAHHHPGQRQHGANGQVDATDQDDQRHAHRHDAEHGDLIHNVEEVAQREECVRRQRQESAEQDQAD